MSTAYFRFIYRKAHTTFVLGRHLALVQTHLFPEAEEVVRFAGLARWHSWCQFHMVARFALLWQEAVIDG